MTYYKQHQGSKINSSGFTAIETMITIGIVGILFTLGSPNFKAIAANTKIKTQVSDFHIAILQTRNEAITRGHRVTLCKSNDGAACTTSGHWNQGWILFTDNITQDANITAGEVVLTTHAALSSGNSLIGNYQVSNYISYTGSGLSSRTSGSFQNGTIALCDYRGAGEGRQIVINTAGRPRVARPARNCTRPTAG